MKKTYIFRTLAAMLLALLLPAGTAAAASADTGLADNDDVTIIYTNDVHTYVDNHEEDDDGNRTGELLSYSNIAAMKENLEAEGANVLLVDDGDYSQGTAYGAIDEGKSVVQIMNAAGYDISTLGNHEFDYGQDRLFEMLDEEEFPSVSCNFYYTEDDTLVLPAYKIFDMDGVSVAFIGISTPDTYTAEPRAYFQDENGNQIYGIYGTEDSAELYASVQAAIDEIGDSADYIIALGHLGVEDSGMAWTSRAVIENTTGLDAFIDGHSHTTMESEIVEDLDGNDVLLTQTGCYLNAIGLMHLRGGEITTELITDYPDRDETVQAMTDELVADVEAELGEQIAVSDDYFYIMDANDPETRIVRNQETNAGDLAADSIYYYFNETADLDCDVAIINGGGVRADISTGNITYETCKAVQPFGNVDCLIRITGSQLREILEYSVKDIGAVNEDGSPTEFGGFLQVAGIRFHVDFDLESTVQLNSDGSWAGAPTGDYKVSDIEIYNRETGVYENLDLEKRYTIAGNNYILRNAGNGYNMFEDSELILDYVSQDYLVTAEYLMAFETADDGWPHICTENSPLASYSGYQLDYENPYGSGRITIDQAGE